MNDVNEGEDKAPKDTTYRYQDSTYRFRAFHHSRA